MAEDADLSRAVGLIAGALTMFAQRRQWKDSEYRIYYWTNPDLDKVHFLFVSPRFDNLDSYEITREVWSFLAGELSEFPALLRSLGLVVRSQKQVDEGGLYAIGSDYKEYWTFYPSKSAEAIPRS